MGLDTNVVKKFFDSPLYLEKTRHVIQIRSMIVREMLGMQSGVNILDIGCGDGSLSIPLLNQNNNLTMLDLSSRMLEIAKSRIPNEYQNKVQLINSPIHEFKPSVLYDIVLCIGVLAHVPSIESTIIEIAKCMKPKGLAIIEFTPLQDPISKLFFPYYMVRNLFTGTTTGYRTNKMSLKVLLKIASNNGLHLRIHKRHSFPLPTMSRWPERWRNEYTLQTFKNPILSKIGVEHVMMFSKD